MKAFIISNVLEIKPDSKALIDTCKITQVYPDTFCWLIILVETTYVRMCKTIRKTKYAYDVLLCLAIDVEEDSCPWLWKLHLSLQLLYCAAHRCLFGINPELYRINHVTNAFRVMLTFIAFLFCTHVCLTEAKQMNIFKGFMSPIRFSMNS